VSALPRRREEAARRLSENVGEDTLSALERILRLFGIQAVHLVGAIGQH
jgi:hypothetical protein